jgi:hypothetical protein
MLEPFFGFILDLIFLRWWLGDGDDRSSFWPVVGLLVIGLVVLGVLGLWLKWW